MMVVMARGMVRGQTGGKDTLFRWGFQKASLRSNRRSSVTTIMIQIGKSIQQEPVNNHALNRGYPLAPRQASNFSPGAGPLCQDRCHLPLGSFV